MAGIVIVSHSQKLAEGVVDIIKMMAPDVLVSTAGGYEDGSYGVCSSRVRDAFRKMRGMDQALVFMDLGSAVAMVQDILAEFPKDKFVLMDCPMVEGSVNAAVMISGGAPLKDVIRASMESRNAFKF